MALIYSDSGAAQVGAGRYVGSIRNGCIYSDSGAAQAGAGRYIGSGKEGSDGEIAAAAVLLGLL